MVWRHISCNYDKLPFKICYKIQRITEKGGLLLALICEFQTYVGVKLDLPCCAGVYNLWRQDYVTIDVHTHKKNHINSFNQALGDSLKMVPA